jgi:hypothetical protein
LPSELIAEHVDQKQNIATVRTGNPQKKSFRTRQIDQNEQFGVGVRRAKEDGR